MKSYVHIHNLVKLFPHLIAVTITAFSSMGDLVAFRKIKTAVPYVFEGAAVLELQPDAEGRLC